MNRTDQPIRSVQLATQLFKDVIIPLAEARRGRTATPYFPLTPEANVSSYFSLRQRRMAPADFEVRGGTAEGLLDTLEALWKVSGDDELAALVPRMREIAEALQRENAENAGEVDVLCYTLF